MSFLNPLFLVALAAVAVPLLIHIFSRRRVPEVPFSTLRFLKRSDRRSMRRINLRRLLLLILRMAAVALVALAFARPVVRGGLAALFPAGGSRAACVLIDRSYSMRFEEEGGTLFDRAKRRAADLAAHLDREDEVTVLLFDTGQEALYAGGSFEREIVLDALRRETPSWYGTDVRAAVEAGWKELAGSVREVRELYVISDFQRSAFARSASGPGGGAASGPASGAMPTGGAATPGSRAGTGPPRARVFLVPVRPEASTNAAIVEVVSPRAALHRGELAKLTVVIRNYSRDLEAVFPLSVAVDGSRIIEKELTIPPEGVRSEGIAFPVERTGWLGGEVRKRGDRLPADDLRYFSLHVRDKTGVLLVADEGSLYLEQALSPEGADGDIAMIKRRWQAVTTADLDAAEVLVLGPGRGPRGSDTELFRRFVESGRMALVLLLPELETAVRGLSRFSPDIEFRRFERGFLTIEPPRGAVPLLAPFTGEDIEALAAVRFRTAAAARGVPERAVILRFRDGSPFIWRESVGEGVIVFAAIDPRIEAGDLVLSPYFLPLIQQAVLAGGGGSEAVAGGLVGGTVVWDGPFGPDHVCLVPGGGEPLPEMPETVAEPGFITVKRGAETVGLIAINPDCSRESDLEGMPEAEAADSLGLSSYLVLEEGMDPAALIHRAREGREIALPLIIAAIALFAAELAVAQRVRGADAGGADVE